MSGMSGITFNSGVNTYNVTYDPTGSQVTVTGANGAPAVLSPDEMQQLQNLLASLTATADTSLPPPDQSSELSPEFWAALDTSQVSAQADMFEFMKLFMLLALEMRKSAREERLTSLQNQVASIDAQATEMRSAADERLQAAIIQGSMQIAAGVVSVVGGAIAMGKAMKASGTDLEIQTALSKVGAINAMSQGLSQIIQGAGTIASATQEHNAAMDDAEAKEQEKIQKLAEAALEMAKEVMSTMMDLLRQIRDTMQAVNQSNTDTAKAIIHNV